MKKLKLRFQDQANTEVLTRDQLKRVLGGEGGSGNCQSNSDCEPGYKCAGLSGFPKMCIKVNAGSSCTSDSDCRVGQQCVNKSYPATGKWCI
ncbi:MAG: hypothetical protein JSS98_11775 [Bacteroidetes bacterium]|nr:hypothetical protein [Bacteroidota bacterium]